MMEAKSKRIAWYLVDDLAKAPLQPADKYAGQLAKRVVTRLADAYGWQSVSVFKVDHRTQTFIMLAQHASGEADEILAGHSEPFKVDSLSKRRGTKVLRTLGGLEDGRRWLPTFIV